MHSYRFIASMLAAMLVTGCASHSATAPMSSFVPNVLLPKVVQTGGSKWAYVATPNLAPGPTVTGPDGRLWFIGGPEGNPSSNVFAMTQTGVITQITNFPDNPNIVGITVGPDKNIWITTYELEGVVKITPAGVLTDLGGGYYLTAICSGPDGNIWYANGSVIDRMTTSGVVTSIQTGLTEITSITAGPDGGIWFTVDGVGSDTIGRIDARTLAVTTVDATQYGPLLGNIVAGGDGNLWTSRQTDGAFVRITPSWSITAYNHGFRKRMEFNPYLTSYGTVLYGAWGYSKELIRFGERSLKPIDATRLPNPTNSEPVSTVIGPDLNLWTTSDYHSEYAVYLLHEIAASPTAITTTIGGMQTLTATERNMNPSRLRAVSSNPAIASVVAGTTAGTFVVTGVSTGQCVITLLDGIGNSLDVPVTVN